MTNDQTKMTKEFPKSQKSDLRFGYSSFFRHSDLGIGHFPRVGVVCEKARKS
jgi:hypothetical protein